MSWRSRSRSRARRSRASRMSRARESRAITTAAVTLPSRARHPYSSLRSLGCATSRRWRCFSSARSTHRGRHTRRRRARRAALTAPSGSTTVPTRLRRHATRTGARHVVRRCARLPRRSAEPKPTHPHAAEKLSPSKARASFNRDFRAGSARARRGGHDAPLADAIISARCGHADDDADGDVRGGGGRTPLRALAALAACAGADPDTRRGACGARLARRRRAARDPGGALCAATTATQCRLSPVASSRRRSSRRPCAGRTRARPRTRARDARCSRSSRAATTARLRCSRNCVHPPMRPMAARRRPWPSAAGRRRRRRGRVGGDGVKRGPSGGAPRGQGAGRAAFEEAALVALVGALEEHAATDEDERASTTSAPAPRVIELGDSPRAASPLSHREPRAAARDCARRRSRRLRASSPPARPRCCPVGCARAHARGGRPARARGDARGSHARRHT